MTKPDEWGTRSRPVSGHHGLGTAGVTMIFWDDARVVASLITLIVITMRMSAGSERSLAHQGGAPGRVLAAFIAAVGLVAVIGCGSSKPGYCSDRTSLENSVKGLTSLNASSGISGLKSQLQKIESNATAVVSSAKSDFPSQTNAITSSVDALKSSVAALATSPSAAEIAAVAKNAASVVSSVKSFTNATSSNCS